MNGELPENHRSRVGAERRERTRARLLESALLVFAEKGPEAAVIDDVIALAGMARGSFYNYFRTNEELLAAVAAEISDELLRVIDPVVQSHDDPAARIACGARLLLHAVRRYPLLGAFLSRLPWPAADSPLIGIGFLARDLEMGLAQKKFADIQARVGVDLVAGTLFSAAHSLSRDALPEDYPEAVVKAILQGLGVSKSDAARSIALSLPDVDLDDNSVLKRTLHRSQCAAKSPG
ncbi:MAG TPA: TetR/AcrR family transcriptional regulator [Noviherbaspirillum sp.]|nr:TetR/AcrR family transcriptional regulator [Noviherbaspirillum sp.]